MACHLLETEIFDSKNDIIFNPTENLIESSQFRLFFCRCAQCDQEYLGCFVELSSLDGEDDAWNFWIPVAQEEMDLLRANPEKAVDLIQTRRHLVCNPVGIIYWNNAPEVALLVGPGIMFPGL